MFCSFLFCSLVSNCKDNDIKHAWGVFMKKSNKFYKILVAVLLALAFLVLVMTLGALLL